MPTHRLLLVNPCNQSVSLTSVAHNRWNRYRVWKPLGLLVIAALTPPDWEVSVIDENLGLPDYSTLPTPDLVGITAFTSQATRAYELAAEFRQRGVKVVMGGIHATMCPQEASHYVDAVVTGEAESVWTTVLDDVKQGRLQPQYTGVHLDMAQVPAARHELLSQGYAFGAIQTTRGCPLNCSFCSVSTFNGKSFRLRPVEKVIEEFRRIKEKWILVVDDNLIGTSKAHLQRTKELFRAMIAADLGKKWIAQVTINMGDDDELLSLASRAGCRGVFIGFEALDAEGLAEVGKKFNLNKGRDPRAAVRRIQRHNILVAGSFIMGLDTDRAGIGERIAKAAGKYGVDLLNVLILTPLPGTRLWEQMQTQNRIASNNFPHDWQYYTLVMPTSRYLHFSWEQIVAEMKACENRFYSRWQIFRRVVGSVLGRRSPVLSLVGNLSYRNNDQSTYRAYEKMNLLRGRMEESLLVATASIKRASLTDAW